MLVLFAPVSVIAQEDYELLWSKENVSHVSISSDGRYIAAACDGKVCLFSKDGNLLWNYRGVAEVDGELHDVSIYFTSISPDGEYIAASGVVYEYTAMVVYLFDKNGNLLWENKTYAALPTSSLCVSPNGEVVTVIYKYGKDKYKYIIYFFNKDGELVWRYDIPTRKVLEGKVLKVSTSYNNNYIVIGGMGEIYFFNKEGELLWSKKQLSKVGVVTSISSDGNFIAAATFRHVYLFDKEGNTLWSRECSPPWVSISSDGEYIATTNGLYNKDGELLWSFEDISFGWETSPPIMSSDGSFIVVLDKNIIYLYNKDGNLVWNYTTDIGCYCMDYGWTTLVNYPLITSDGSYIAAWGKGKLYFFGKAGTAEVAITELTQTPTGLTTTETPTTEKETQSQAKTPEKTPGFDFVEVAVALAVSVGYIVKRIKRD